MSVKKLAVYARTLAAASVLGALAVPGPAQAAASPPDKPSDTGPRNTTSTKLAEDDCVHMPPNEPGPTGSSTRHRPSPRYSTKKAAGDVFVTDATGSANSTGGEEPSIAVNPRNPDQVVITRFGATCWDEDASLLYSTDGGQHWTNYDSIPRPTNVPETDGCPCDQTIDYGRDGTLYGTFLIDHKAGLRIVTGSTTDPTKASAWKWNGDPAQLTNQLNDTDQNQILVNRDPSIASQDNVYVLWNHGLQQHTTPTQERLGVSYGANPVNITVRSIAGSQTPAATLNPGPRLAGDHNNGTIYALYEQSSTPKDVQPKVVTYKLNRSTDGGRTWSLNGSADGVTVDTVPSVQWPFYKFAGNSRVEGGLDDAAVDPTTGDVYVVYGQEASGNNQLKIRRLTSNGSGGLNVGPAHDVSTSHNIGLPTVAVLDNGTIGVLYDTSDGTTPDGFPIVTAHLARSTDHGATFTDTVLSRFDSPKPTSDPQQDALGDYQGIRAVGNTFHGVFAGNLLPVPTANPFVHAIYFKTAPPVPPPTKGSVTTTLTSSYDPSTHERPVTFTDRVCPKDPSNDKGTPTGAVTFTVDGRVLGTRGLTAGGGTHCARTKITTSRLRPGRHTINAYYGGDDHYFRGPIEQLTQTVVCPRHHHLRGGGGSGGSCRRR